MECPIEFSRRMLNFFIVYTDDELNAIFRYRPYSRKADKRRLEIMARRFGYMIEAVDKDYPEVSNGRIQYSTIYRTNIPWEWYREPSHFADVNK